MEAVIDLEKMHQSAGDAAQFLRSLANKDRLLLLCHLSQDEYCVSDLEGLTGITQPTLSQQLGVLRRESLVATRRDGKQIYYRIADAKVMLMLQQLYGLFCADNAVD
ncbi:metalloregulator ArsR/SmtB family transcription factor [Marinobacteraceae bacterium S3BR75-40.1]